MRCSRSGGITPSSPTLRKRPPTPISPTVATPSSRPCSPTSSTARWRICPQDASAPTPPGSCAPRSPTTCCDALGVLAGGTHAVARGATLRRRIVTIPARLARPQRRPVLHLPRHWPWSHHWLALWRNTIGFSPPVTATTVPTPRKARPENTQEKLGRPATRPCPPPETTATTLTAPHANR